MDTAEYYLSPWLVARLNKTQSSPPPLTLIYLGLLILMPEYWDLDVASEFNI